MHVQKHVCMFAFMHAALAASVALSAPEVSPKRVPIASFSYVPSMAGRHATG